MEFLRQEQETRVYFEREYELSQLLPPGDERRDSLEGGIPQVVASRYWGYFLAEHADQAKGRALEELALSRFWCQIL
jgi:hypothetical protein